MAGVAGSVWFMSVGAWEEILGIECEDNPFSWRSPCTDDSIVIFYTWQLKKNARKHMNSEMRGYLRSCANLPTLSAVARRIIKIGRNSDMDLGEVAKLLSSDPVLAKQMLRVANSPLYRQRRRPDNLRQALVLLGLNDAVISALGSSLATCLRNAGGQEIDLDGFWRRALLSGLACRLAR